MSSAEKTSTAPAPAASAERTCVVCRTQRRPGELLRIREREGIAYIEGPTSGRGAWVCVQQACIDALESRALSRALHRSVSLPAEGMREVVARIAEQRVYSVLGLARRQGVLIVGQDRVATEPAGCVLYADEASPRSREAAGPDAKAFGTIAELSRATGLKGVAVLGIAPGSLAQQAAYWLTVWYETRARDSGRGRDASI